MADFEYAPRPPDESMNVFYPVPNSIELVRFDKSLFRNLHSTASGSKLELLPAELITNISKHLPLTSRINLAMSSKHLARLARTNGVISFDPEALTRSDIELLRQIMPFQATAVLLCKTQIEPLDIYCSHCWNTRYAALELCQESFWVGTGPALDLRYHMKLELKRLNDAAVFNMRDIMHLIRGFVRWEKAEYMRKLNRPAAFLTLKYRKAIGVAGK